ncbi:MAG: hypothetical protein WB987_03390 [Candidatus Acidiferrales bacterium]
MPRIRFVCALAVVGASVVAYSLPRLAAQSDSAGGSESVPIVVASGISARALALAPLAAMAENSVRPNIYLTTLDQPSQVLAFAGTMPGAAAMSSRSNLSLVAGGGGTGSLGDGGAATAAQLNLKVDSLAERSGVAVAADGSIFISDTRNSTIRRIASPSGSDAGVIRSVAGKWAPPQEIALIEPMGIALDRAGNLYIADHGANALIELHGATSAIGGRLEMLAHISQPASIAVTADGSRIFITAPQTRQAFVFESHTRAISQILGASPSAQDSTLSASGTGCENSSVPIQELSPCPAGIAVDGGGNLFVADATTNQILRIDGVTRKMKIAATGIAAPGEIAFDMSGNLFIAEQGRSRISEIQGLGQPSASLTLTPPASISPPAGTPCPTIGPPAGFSSVTNFCAEPLSGATPTAPFILTNDTNADLAGLTIGTSGLDPTDFVNSSSSCTAALRANSSCTINLSFVPTASGPRTATLQVNYAGAQASLNAAVAGTGEDYQITLASGQLTEISILAGNTGTFMLQVVPDNVFTGTVNFVCPGNMPAQTTCMFSPGNSVNVTTPGTAVPFSVSFQTTSRQATKNHTPSASSSNGQNRHGPTWTTSRFRPGLIIAPALGSLAFVALCGLVIFAVPRRRSQLPRITSVFALFSIVVAILVGCGSYKSGQTTGTPKGSTKMTVQGATQGASRGITVTLDVE